MIFYPIKPENTFVYVGRSVLPTYVKKDLADSYLAKVPKDHSVRFHWSIDLIKTPENPHFLSTMSIADANGEFRPQEVTHEFTDRRDILEFLSLPSRLFEPTRIGCFVFNRAVSNWDSVLKKIMKWSADN
jgi:hypothetical protein